MSIEWEDPPLSNYGRRGSVNHQLIADQLRQHPGQWAKVFTDVNSSRSANISQARIAAFRPAGAFEAVARNSHRDGNGKLKADIYARYVGEETL